MNSRLKSLIRTILPRTISKHRILAGPIQGSIIVTSWFDYPAAILGKTERSLLEWFSRNVEKGDTWLDVGAHYGYTAIALSQLVGKDGRVFAFEPLLSTAGFLSQTRRINHFPQLRIMPFALGDPDNLGLLSLPTTRGMVDSTGNGSSWFESILVAKFDWLWTQICSSNETIDGIKIDVQGMELDVLRGMVGVLKKIKPKLVIELHHGVDRRDVLNFLNNLGYSNVGIPIEPIKGEKEPLYLDDRSYAFLSK